MSSTIPPTFLIKKRDWEKKTFKGGEGLIICSGEALVWGTGDIQGYPWQCEPEKPRNENHTYKTQDRRFSWWNSLQAPKRMPCAAGPGIPLKNRHYTKKANYTKVIQQEFTDIKVRDWQNEVFVLTDDGGKITNNSKESDLEFQIVTTCWARVGGAMVGQGSRWGFRGAG